MGVNSHLPSRSTSTTVGVWLSGLPSAITSMVEWALKAIFLPSGTTSTVEYGSRSMVEWALKAIFLSSGTTSTVEWALKVNFLP